MTKRERILAALRGEEVDRVPVAAWRHFPGRDYTAEQQVESFLAFQYQFDWDFMKMMFRNSFPIEDWGGSVRDLQVPYGWYLPLKYAVEKTADWRSLPVLDPNRGTLGEMLAVTRGVRSRLREELPVLATVFSPLTVARHLAGDRRLFSDLRERPEALHPALEVISETVAAFARALLENGADGIFFATQLNNRDLLEQAEYAAFGHPYNLRVLERIEGRSAFTLLHVCGRNIRFAEYAGYPVQAINWEDRAASPSLREARSITDRCLVGGIDKDQTLRTGSPEQVAAQARDAVRSAGRRKLIVAPGCGIPVDCPDDNLFALRRAAEG